MWVETKQRILEILNTLTAVPDTFYDLKAYIPGFRSDANHYLITVKPTRDAAQPITSAETRNHILNWTIEITSPQVGTENEILHEYYIEAYADSVTALLDQYPRLESVPSDSSVGRLPLTGVLSTFQSGAQFQTPRAYPQGSPLNHYSVSVPLQVSFKRSTGC